MAFKRIVFAALCLFGIALIAGALYSIQDLNRVAASGGEVTELATVTHGFLWIADSWMTMRNGPPVGGHSPAELARFFTYLTTGALVLGVLALLGGIAAWRVGAAHVGEEA